MELFARIANGFQQFTILPKSSILDVRLFSEYTSEVLVEAVYRSIFLKKLFLKISQNSVKNTCASLPVSLKLQGLGLQLYKKETLAQVFSWEFFEISKNTFMEHLWWLRLDIRKRRFCSLIHRLLLQNFENFGVNLVWILWVTAVSGIVYSLIFHEK